MNQSDEIMIFITQHNVFFIVVTIAVWFTGYVMGISKGLKLK